MDIVAMFSLYFPQTFAEVRKINTNQWAGLAAHFCNSNNDKHPQRRWAGAFISERYLLVLHYYYSLKCNHPSKCICRNFKMYLSKIQNSICICINFEGKTFTCSTWSPFGVARVQSSLKSGGERDTWGFKVKGSRPQKPTQVISWNISTEARLGICKFINGLQGHHQSSRHKVVTKMNMGLVPARHLYEFV